MLEGAPRWLSVPQLHRLILSRAMKQHDPLKIFVSHIHEEAPLAAEIKSGLEDAFAGNVEVFVSSDPATNPGGVRWLDKIERELKDPQTRMLVSLVSPASIQEPWISIELGAAWVRGHAVFPLCHSGQEVGQLPRPLGDFGGADLTNHNDAASRLIGAVEKATGLQAPKRWATDGFLADMRRASLNPAQRAHPIPATVKPAKTETDLPAEQVRILQVLARSMNGGTNEIKDDQAAQLSGLKPAVFAHHVKQLENKELVYVNYGMYGNYARITSDGSGWLIEHGQMPE